MQCPICKKSVTQPADLNQQTPFPFCSERCKLIDLGRWLDGKYQITLTPDEEEVEYFEPPAIPEDEG